MRRAQPLGLHLARSSRWHVGRHGWILRQFHRGADRRERKRHEQTPVAGGSPSRWHRNGRSQGWTPLYAGCGRHRLLHRFCQRRNQVAGPPARQGKLLGFLPPRRRSHLCLEPIREHHRFQGFARKVRVPGPERTGGAYQFIHCGGGRRIIHPYPRSPLVHSTRPILVIGAI